MNTNRLQLLHHSGVFVSKAAMETYIVKKYDGLIAEPFVMFYKEGEETRMVLAIGNPDNEYYGCELIDIKALESKIAEIEEKLGELTEELAALRDALTALEAALAEEVATRERVDANIAELCGFTLNAKTGEYEYHPDSKDLRIADAQSLAEAIDMISKSIVDYTFEESKSVRFNIEEDGTKRTVKAEVKLSKEDRDEDGHDDNIIVKYSDGIGAYIDLKYDADKGGLLFTRSTTESKKHKTTLIEIPTHTDVQLDKKSDLQYDLVVDGVVVGSIMIPEDQFFRGASYDARVHELTLTFRINGQDETVVIPLTDLVDVYKAGDGLALNNNGKFSVVKSAASEEYLVVNSNGVAVIGVNAAIATAKDEAKAEAQSLVNTKADELIGHADAGVDEMSLHGLRNRIDANATQAEAEHEAMTSELKAYTDTAKEEALADAKVYTDTAKAEAVEEAKDYTDAAKEDAIEEAKTYTDAAKAEAVEEALAADIKTITVHTKNAADNQVVEVKNGDAKIEMGQLNLYVNDTFARSFAPGLGGSKTSQDGTAFGSFALNFTDSDTAKVKLGASAGKPSLSVEVKEGVFAKKSDIDALADVYEAKGTAQKVVDALDLPNTYEAKGAAAAVKAELEPKIADAEKRATIVASDSTSLKLHAVKGLEGTELSGSVVVSHADANALVEKADGLYAPAFDLSYNEALNILTVTYGGVSENIQLTGVTAFTDVRYDSEHQSLVMTVKNEEGTKEISIPLAGLIPLIEGSGDDTSVIKVSVDAETKDDGDKIYRISAQFNGYAKDVKTAYHIDETGEDLTDADMTFQHILNQFSDILSRLGLVETKLTEVETKVEAAKATAANALEKATEAKEKADALETRVNGIDAYTVNGKKISTNPVLEGDDITVGGDSSYKNDTIAEAIENLEDAVNNIDFSTLKVEDSKTETQVVSSVSETDGKITVTRYTLKPKANDESIVIEQTGDDIEFNVGNIDCGTF